MRQFKDTAGREWTIQINISAVKRVRDLAGIDLLGLVSDKELLPRLIEDLVLLAGVLYALCQPQAQAAAVTPEKFGEGLGGDAISHAVDAMLEELADFFPKPQVRAAIKRILAASKRLDSLTMERLEKASSTAVLEELVQKQLNEIDAKVAAAGAGALGEKNSGDSSGKSPASSDSTPAPLRLAT